LGCSTEESKQAPSSVDLGLDCGSSTSAEDERVAIISVLSGVHVGCHGMFSSVWVQMPCGSVGPGAGVLLYSYRPTQDWGPGHDGLGKELHGDPD